MEFKIQNMVGSCDVKFPIRLEGLVLAHSQFSRSVWAGADTVIIVVVRIHFNTTDKMSGCSSVVARGSRGNELKASNHSYEPELFPGLF